MIKCFQTSFFVLFIWQILHTEQNFHFIIIGLILSKKQNKKHYRILPKFGNRQSPSKNESLWNTVKILERGREWHRGERSWAFVLQRPRASPQVGFLLVLQKPAAFTGPCTKIMCFPITQPCPELCPHHCHLHICWSKTSCRTSESQKWISVEKN